MAQATPQILTYQGRIQKTDGLPLEYNNVSFNFQILDSSKQCVVFAESLHGFNMAGSRGYFDIVIGNGTRIFPTSVSFKVTDSFYNSGSLNCLDGSTMSPTASDTRYLRVKFHDGVSWKTIAPDMEIRSVPYAAHSQTAESAQKLGNNIAADFLTFAGLPTCGAGQFLTYDGTALTCAVLSGGGGGGGSGTVTSVSSANTDISILTGTSTPVLTLNSGTAGGVGDGNKIAKLNASGVLPSTMIPSLDSAVLATGTIDAARLPAFTGDATSTAGSTALTLKSSGVTAGSYGSESQVASLTVDAQGRITAAANSAISIPWSAISSGVPSTLIGYGITDGVKNAGGVGQMSAGLDASKPGAPASGDIFVATDTQKIYQFNSGAWSLIASGAGSGGTVTSVSSTNADISVATGTSTPSLTLNSGTSANQIVKLDGTAKLPAVDGSQLTNFTATQIPSLDAAKITTGSLAVARGGTGQSTYADGEILIGNTVTTSLTKATLTAGSGVSITNGNGSITIAATGGTGTVTSVSGTAPINVATGTSTPVISLANGSAAGQVYRWDGISAWAATKLNYTDLVNTSSASPWPATSCAAGEAITWSSVSDSFACTSLSIAASQLTGTIDAARMPGFTGDATSSAGSTSLTLKNSGVTAGSYGSGSQVPSLTVDTQGRITVASNSAISIPWSAISSGKPTTISGYGITDSIQNLGGSPGIQTGTDTSKPATPTAGTIYFATDTQKIYQFNSGVWSLIASGTGSIPNTLSTYSVRAATTSNITLSGTQTIDDVVLVAGDRVLVKNQTTDTQNGIYVVSSGAWTRATDMSNWAQTIGYTALVMEGTAWRGNLFSSATVVGGTLGSSPLYWNSRGGSGSVDTFAAGTINNTAFGYNALNSNTIGDSNVAVGSLALYFNTTGGSNVGIGRFALFANTTGASNTATGYTALNSNTTGMSNTANGSSALKANTTGSTNTAIGSSALIFNTTGFSNTVIGSSALYSNSTGSKNTVTGAGALGYSSAKSEATAVGYQSMGLADPSTTPAISYNTAVGAYSLMGSPSAGSNTGVMNTAIGHSSLYGISSGSGNIGIGYNAGSAITTGSNNVVIGSNTGSAIGTSSDNILISDGAGNERIRINSSGNVGIGTTSPRAGLDVNSTLVTKAATSNATSSIDFSTGNLQYTANSCSAFQFNNLKDGGSYMFAVKGTTSATCSFTAFSDAGVTALTVHLPPDHGATIAAKHTLYNLVIIGTDVYLSWTPGY